MEKELIQESLFGNSVQNKVESGKIDPKERHLFYQGLLQGAVEPEEIEDTLFIDPLTELPEDFPEINNYVKALGNELVDIKIKFKEFRIIFEGGEVQYNIDPFFDSYQVSQIVVYGSTTEPGVRSLYTRHLDTNLYFEMYTKELLKYAKDSDLLYRIDDNSIMKITIANPEVTNIKDWWSK
ncbi:MAG: hypothetical protein RBT33_01725 [Candidatus Dojkabacteria bacterium]|jgi:hypothetical protein|nr:hypothetical protein [Candidatus Dojkabacteria bacterium]